MRSNEWIFMLHVSKKLFFFFWNAIVFWNVTTVATQEERHKDHSQSNLTNVMNPRMLNYTVWGKLVPRVPSSSCPTASNEFLRHVFSVGNRRMSDWGSLGNAIRGLCVVEEQPPPKQETVSPAGGLKDVFSKGDTWSPLREQEERRLATFLYTKSGLENMVYFEVRLQLTRPVWFFFFTPSKHASDQFA